MASFISSSDKNNLNNVFNDLHDTFSRPITIYKTSQRVVIQTNPNHNFLFDGAPSNSVVETVKQSGVFNARVWYPKKELSEPFSTAPKNNAIDQIGLVKTDGDVRIKLDPTGASFLQSAVNVTFDGSIFEIVSAKRPHGLFDPNFETFWLKKVN